MKTLNKPQIVAIHNVLTDQIGYAGSVSDLELINTSNKISLPNKWSIEDVELVRNPDNHPLSSTMIRVKSPTLEDNASTRCRISGLNERIDQINCVFQRFVPGVC